MINNIPVEMILSYQDGDYLIGNSNSKNGLPWGKELEKDKEFFWSKIDNNTLVVLGGNTYDLIKDIIIKKYGEDFLNKNCLLPSIYTFSLPSTFIDNHIKYNYIKYYKTFNKVLVIGGKRTYEMFLDSGLVDTIYMTKIVPLKFKYKGDCYLSKDFMMKIIRDYKKISYDEENSYIYQLNYPKVRTVTPYQVRYTIKEYRRYPEYILRNI